MGLYKKRAVDDLMNSAINMTMSRTINTSLTVLFVLLAIFIFGGEVIRSFSFALIIGVIAGTYSTVFVASALAFDTFKKQDKNN